MTDANGPSSETFFRPRGLAVDSDQVKFMITFDPSGYLYRSEEGPDSPHKASS